MKFFATLIVASAAVVNAFERCYAPSVSTLSAALATNITEEVARRDIRPYGYGYGKTFTIDTYTNIITTKTKKNKYPKAQVEKQLQVLNDRFRPYRFQFRNKGIKYIVNDRWANITTEDQFAVDTEFKTKLRKGTYQTLNIYFLSDLALALGYATLPIPNPTAEDKIFDGVVNWAETLPGGDAVVRNATTGETFTYNLGYTAVHEVGHWLSLLHTFSEPDDPNVAPSCTKYGDFVKDTPAQLTPTRGCPKGKDTCPKQKGLDPIQNYMDYSDDPCYTMFTQGQVQRMVGSFQKFRAGK